MADRRQTVAGPLYTGNAVHGAVARVEQDTRLDAPSRRVRQAVQRAVPGGPLKDFLSGTWLGHPLHPMLTDLPIGFWTSAWVLDIIGPRRYRDAARVLVGLGVLSALPAAATGAADWSDTTGRTTRVGLVHAAANSSAAALYLGSWLARRKGHHARGVALGMAGAAAATVGGYLGGRLVHDPGVGVDANLDRTGPDDWVAVLDVAELDETPTRVDVEGLAGMVFRHDGDVVALGATCPHRGAPLDEGSIVDGCVECPWHASRFRIPDGALLRGPAASPLPRLEARERGGTVEVRARLP